MTMDVYSVISPWLRISRLMGLAPYILSGPPGKRTLNVSCLLIFYGLTLTVFYVVCAVAPWAFKETFQQNLQYTISNAESTYELTLAAFLLASTAKNAAGIVRLYHRVNLIDRSLKTADVYLPWPAMRRDNIYRLSFGIGQFVVAVLGSTGLLLVFRDQSFSVLVIAVFYSTFFLMKFVNYAFVSGYHSIVLVAHRLFLELNVRLNALLEGPAKADVLRDKSLVKCLQKNHLRSCAVVEGVNQLFAASVLLYVGSVFGALVIGLNTCFNSIMMLKASDAADDSRRLALVQIGFSLYVTAIFVIQLSRLCLACERCCQEARRTALPVHKLILDPRFAPCRSQLETFSLQLLQQQVHFSGGGFFHVNAALLSSIAGGVTSLMVILIQFQLTPATKTASTS